MVEVQQIMSWELFQVRIIQMRAITVNFFYRNCWISYSIFIAQELPLLNNPDAGVSIDIPDTSSSQQSRHHGNFLTL